MEIKGSCEANMNGTEVLVLDFQEMFANSYPLGLTLKKSQSLVSLVSPQQQQEVAPMQVGSNQGSENEIDTPERKLNRLGSQHLTREKLKASNFPIHTIKIGSWQRTCRNEGELIAKVYYAKRKIVWEVLDGPLKSKIEIVWSDISAIQAILQDNKHGILKIQVNKPPSFFGEITPTPRKHTNWQRVTDFTDGQAHSWRIHCVSFPPKVLDKHYEKLLQCDQHLLKLSQQPFPSQEFPYFHASNMNNFNAFPNNFNGFGSSYAQSITDQQFQHLNFPTIHRGLPVGPPPPLDPVMDFPHRNEAPRNYQIVSHQNHYHQPININTEEFVTQTPPIANQVFIDHNDYQTNGHTMTLSELENYLASDDSEAVAMESLLEYPMNHNNNNNNYSNNYYDQNNIVANTDHQVMMQNTSNGVNDFNQTSQPIRWMQQPDHPQGHHVAPPFNHQNVYHKNNHDQYVYHNDQDV